MTQTAKLNMCFNLNFLSSCGLVFKDFCPQSRLLTRSFWILTLTWWALLLALSIRSSSNGEGFFNCSSIKSCKFVRFCYQQRRWSLQLIQGVIWDTSVCNNVRHCLFVRDCVPAVQPLPARAFSWVSEWRVSVLLGPKKHIYSKSCW